MRFHAIPAFLLAAVCATGFLRAGVNPETGAYIFQHYTPHQYGAAPENWAIAQDHRGVMYFGNTDALLEFDGQSWRSIRLSNGTFVRAVAVDQAGTVYVGGVGIFGMLRPDAAGTMQFVSLLDKVAAVDRTFSDIWRILTTPKGVYFSAYERLFRLEPNGSLHVWRPAKNFGRAVTMQDELYVKTPEKGLMKMEGDALTPVPGGEVFQKIGVTAADSTRAGGLIATPSGFFRLDEGGIKPFSSAADPYFAANLLYTMQVFPDGEIAAGTRKGGLVLLGADGSLDRILTKASGLTDDYVSTIFRDRQGGVWLAGNNGITFLNPGITRFESNSGLKGDVKAVVRTRESLYAGGNGGMFRIRAAGAQEPTFERIAGIETTVHELLSRGDQVLAATDSGVFAVSGGNGVQVFNADGALIAYALAVSTRDPAVIYVAGSGGVFMLRQQGKTWVRVAAFTAAGQEFRSVREDPGGRVWATTHDAIWRLDFRGATVQAESFGDDRGAPAGWKNLRMFRGHMVFATPGGLKRYSEATRRFEPDGELGQQFADGSRDVFDLFDDPGGNVWVTGAHYHGLLVKPAHESPDKYQWLNAPLLSAGIQEIYEMTFDADGTAWAFGAQGVLHRWQRSLYGNPDENFQVLTRRVGIIGATQTIFGGAGEFQATRLPYRDNALRFEFAAPFFEAPAAVEYQVMLEGNDRDWSAWGSETKKDYTHLPEGSYRFRVRARSPHGAVSENSALAFGVLPPWYRTWWAYSIYAILAGFGVWGIVGVRTRKLVQEKERLEEIVEERTVEIREQRDEIHRQERKGHSLLLNILPESVAEELKTHGRVRPVGFDDVTVCFTDFAGFTLSSETLSPDSLVDRLNEYFTAFDEIVARYGLEKLKTIGDSYMFASGLPAPRRAHAVDAVLAAMEMVEVVERLASLTGWAIRVGLHSGPVVAGVVGTRKFAFDIWGNTVNLASRMESSGVPGRVNLSQNTYQLTRGLIDCEARGHVHTKDGRDLPMFLVDGPARELLNGPATDGIPAAFAIRYEAEFGEKLRAFRATSLRAAAGASS